LLKLATEETSTDESEQIIAPGAAGYRAVFDPSHRLCFPVSWVSRK